jgi:serine/threonine protein kinase
VFVDFFGWFKDGSNVFLAMEYVPLGDLEKNVKAHSGKIPEVEARDIAEQVLLGLEIMHAESFAHRDLKPQVMTTIVAVFNDLFTNNMLQNLLVIHGPPKWWVKLADFGLSKRLTELTAYRTKSGTQSYMAPEILDYLDTSSEDYTNAVDLWAVGCITYRLVTGVVPFPPGKSLLKYCEDKSLFPYDALLDSGIKSLCSNFIKGLLETGPMRRPSASHALNHAWINSSRCTYIVYNAYKLSEIH